jgi:hypothetical protein
MLVTFQPLAEIIPAPDLVRARIERLETELRLLRRLLTVSLCREREADRLAQQQEGRGHAH